jgi:thiamine-monophosphate kinase
MAQPPDQSRGADEFDIIARHFAPLAASASARGLIDDVALLRTSGNLIVTADAIIEGVHFLPDDPLDLVARKALRVNVSDIVAKGGAPTHYVFTLVWPDHRDASEIAALARGLEFDQRFFRLEMLGGDTTRTPGPLTLAITMFGAPSERTPSRADAKIGDDLWVTGTIGDAGLGLDVLRGALESVDGAHAKFLAQRYQTPEPPVMFAPIVGALAHASCDVSDGLLADAAKIAAASDVRIEIDLGAVPLSAPASQWAASDEARIARLASAGDDYEILFTAQTIAREDILLAAHGMGLRVTRIGRVSAGKGARLIGASGPVTPASTGWSHRLGAGGR